MRKQARRDSAAAWIRSGAEVTVKSYAKRYGVDSYTAYEDLTAIGLQLPDAAKRWAQRPPAVARRSRPRADTTEAADIAASDWMWVGDRRMFVVGFTSGGAPYGCFEDEMEF